MISKSLFHRFLLVEKLTVNKHTSFAVILIWFRLHWKRLAAFVASTQLVATDLIQLCALTFVEKFNIQVELVNCNHCIKHKNFASVHIMHSNEITFYYANTCTFMRIQTNLYQNTHTPSLTFWKYMIDAKKTKEKQKRNHDKWCTLSRNLLFWEVFAYSACGWFRIFPTTFSSHVKTKATKREFLKSFEKQPHCANQSLKKGFQSEKQTAMLFLNILFLGRAKFISFL